MSSIERRNCVKDKATKGELYTMSKAQFKKYLLH